MTTEERISTLEQRLTELTNRTETHAQAIDQLETRSHIHHPSEHHTVDWNENTIDTEPTPEYPNSGGWTQQKAKHIHTKKDFAPDLQCKGEVQGETDNPLCNKDLANRETLENRPETPQTEPETEPTLQDYQAALTTAIDDKLAMKRLYYREAATAEALTVELAKARQDCQKYTELLTRAQEWIANTNVAPGARQQDRYSILRDLHAALQPTL